MGKTDAFEVAAMSRGDHACLAYDSGAQFREIVTTYFSAGIQADERLGYFAPQDKLAEITGWLAAGGHDVGGLAARGQIVLGEVSATYAPGGRFDPDGRLRAYAAMVDEALDDGFSGLRVVGDAAELLTMPVVSESWSSYELRADLLTSTRPMTALCTFDRRVCGHAAFDQVTPFHSSQVGSDDAAPPFRVASAEDGGIRIEGEIDFGNAEHVAHLLREAAADAAPVIDVSRLAFSDVAGVRAIAAGARALRAHHAAVEIRGAGAVFRRLWELLAYSRDESIRIAP